MAELSFESPVLAGWKEIAKYLNMGVRTVQRYERERELPVRRPAGGRGLVIATKRELDQWLTAPPRRALNNATQQSSPPSNSLLMALQAGTLRMRQLRDEITRRRGEMRAALDVLHASIRVVDTGSVSLFPKVLAGTPARQEGLIRSMEGARRQAS
jgi:excisionase family DNA binding protein